MNPFKKIRSENIKLQTFAKKIEFSYVFSDKQEKELNLAAGRIQRKTCTNWRLEGNRLIKSFVLPNAKDSFSAPFGEISELFEAMIK